MVNLSATSTDLVEKFKEHPETLGLLLNLIPFHDDLTLEDAEIAVSSIWVLRHLAWDSFYHRNLIVLSGIIPRLAKLIDWCLCAGRISFTETTLWGVDAFVSASLKESEVDFALAKPILPVLGRLLERKNAYDGTCAQALCVLRNLIGRRDRHFSELMQEIPNLLDYFVHFSTEHDLLITKQVWFCISGATAEKERPSNIMLNLGLIEKMEKTLELTVSSSVRKRVLHSLSNLCTTLEPGRMDRIFLS